VAASVEHREQFQQPDQRRACGRPPARSSMAEPRYAVIGESEGDPILYHMNQTLTAAEQLRLRREAAVGQPCFIVPMAAWRSDPRGALREAQGARQGTP